MRETLDGAQWLMLCGSLPPGVPANFYGKLIAMARQEEGEDPAARRRRRAARRHRGAADRGHAEPAGGGAAARRARCSPARSTSKPPSGSAPWDRNRCVLSLGSRGAIGAFADGLYEALPPRVDAVCPIGAGDALTAGVCLVDAP